jgi:hypothetical protein
VENKFLLDCKIKTIEMAKIIDKRKIIKKEGATKVLVASY